VELDPKGFFNRICEALGAQNAPDVARKLGISKHAVYLWANGKMPGLNGLKNVIKIAELSGASLYWLLTGQGAGDTVGSERGAPASSGQLIVEFTEPVIAVLKQLAAEKGITVADAVERATSDLLRSRGLLREAGKEVTVVLYGDQEPNLIPVRVIGEIEDGSPLRNYTGLRMERVAAEFRPLERGAQALRVVGDSFSEASIYDGDLIVFAPQGDASSGQTVIALVDDASATIKTIYNNRGELLLRSRKLEVPDILLPADRVTIIGVVLGIQRADPERKRETTSAKP
jgi:repressor LexA